MTFRQILLATVLIFGGIATFANAQSTIAVGPQSLMGVAIGTEAESAVAALTAKLGAGDDSGWVDGCEFNGVKERYISWGGLSASFEETSELGNVFINWSYGIDHETGGSIPGGPTVDQIMLPRGIKMGSKFSNASNAFGVDPMVDDVFGIGIFSGQYFEMMSADDDLNGPVAQVAVPHFSYCE